MIIQQIIIFNYQPNSIHCSTTSYDFLPDDLVSVPNPSIALLKGLLFLLLRVGVVSDPKPPSARLLTLVLLPLMFHPASDLTWDWLIDSNTEL